MAEVSIKVTDLGKEYHYQTVFHHLNRVFNNNNSVSVLGENGSGKSTLIRVLSGMTGPTHGEISWLINGQSLSDYKWYQYFSFCSPEFHFDDRFTVREIIHQYVSVKPLRKDMNPDEMVELIGFQAHQHKKVSELSSGMNQRVRLALAVCADVPVLFLDEPCSNLDHKGVRWYNELIDSMAVDKLVFVASNDPREYEFCSDHVSLMEYK